MASGREGNDPAGRDGETDARSEETDSGRRDSAGDDDRTDPVAEDAPLLATVARNVPIVLFALDDDGVFTRSEGRGLAALGLEQGEVVGKSAFDVYADHPAVLRAVERALGGEDVNVIHEFGDVAFEVWYRSKEDGHVLGVAVDVTDRVRHERLMERLNDANRRLLEAGSKQAVAEQVVDIAHEVLDQPYTGVWFHEPGSDELASVAGDGPAREYRDRVMRADSVEMDVFRSGEPRLFPDYGRVERPAFPDATVGTLLLLPLGDHGLLSVADADVVEIEPAERDLIEILARDATVALDRAERERLLERLNEATRDLVVAESEAEIADRIVEINRQVLDEPASVVWLYDAEAGVLEAVAGTTEEEAEGGHARPHWELDPIEPGTAEMDAFVRKEPTNFWDYATVEDAAHPETDLGAILAVPIGDVGLLTVGAPSAADMGASTPDLVEILARDAAVAIERVERESALEALHTATRALMAAGTREEIARLTVDTTEDVLGHPMAVVRLVSPDGERLEPVARSDWIRDNLGERPSFRVGEGSIGTVYADREVRLFDRSELTDLDVEDSTRTLLSLPIGGHGVLTIGESEPSAFGDPDVQLAKVLASNVETALDRVDRELELERRNERLDQFASIVSHDLRNPLNVISGHVDLAEVEEPHRSTIEAATGRMRSIIDDVLALAREGRVVDDPAPTDLGHVVRLAWASVDTGEATLAVETDRQILADDERLQRLLENLFRNSVEHGPDDVSVRVGEADGGFFVDDDGPGVPPEDQESVFDPGFSTAEGGTGLGLAIVTEIAEAHGWTVAVEDGSEGGARFVVTGVEDA